MSILNGVRPLDYVLAAVFTAGGAFLMYENATATETGLPHAQSTTTWAMLPFFVLVTLPILWRRRNILAVVAATGAATALHVILFGWNTRCGVELPLTFALAYAIGRFGGTRTNQMIGLALILVVQIMMIARDASIDTIIGAVPIAIPGAALLYGLGVLVEGRVAKKQAPAVVAVAA
jgi:hypothetical protein